MQHSRSKYSETNSQAAGNITGDSCGLTDIDSEECDTYQQNESDTLAVKSIFDRDYFNESTLKRVTKNTKYANINQRSPIEEQDPLIIKET
ncbi:hypothetical protein LIER_41437 [Lithospermum erythrorhizon]|uniref:Uncharacterized protein n=1 Tax=Lithospermum erythrorhizon TaxID=34254 RepID=A0AAV3RF61_LITER